MPNINDYNAAVVALRGTEGLLIAKEARLTKKNSLQGDVRDYFDRANAVYIEKLTLITNLNAYGEAIANLEETNPLQFEAELNVWKKCIRLSQHSDFNKTLSITLKNATHLINNQDQASFVALQHSIATLNSMAKQHQRNGKAAENSHIDKRLISQFIFSILMFPALTALSVLVITAPHLVLGVLIGAMVVSALIIASIFGTIILVEKLRNKRVGDQESKQANLLTEAAQALDEAKPIYLTDTQAADIGNKLPSVDLSSSSSTGFGFFTSLTSKPISQTLTSAVEYSPSPY